ncbi:hypothetical protein GHT06_016590 [Daphnia sinensis]|uniref:Uncharacterized protein n=1 Tax=Daphnia sinensis TaxID=1820382 RepID=A0AAD5PU49_9CRUS|nr:hypothetical protein GHT06_016590 [Daphnia sinensis]
MEFLCLLFSRLSLQIACFKRKRTEESPFEAVRLKKRAKRRCLLRPTVRLGNVYPGTCDRDREVSTSVPESRPAEPPRKRSASENDECFEPGSSKRACRTVIAIPPTRVPPNMPSVGIGCDSVHRKKINKQPQPVPKIEVTIKQERPQQLLPVDLPVHVGAVRGDPKVRTVKVRNNRPDQQPEPVKRTSVFDRLGEKGVEKIPVLPDPVKPSVFQRLGERPSQGFDRERPGRWTHGKKPYHHASAFNSQSASGNTTSTSRWYRSDGRAFRRI